MDQPPRSLRNATGHALALAVTVALLAGTAWPARAVAGPGTAEARVTAAAATFAAVEARLAAGATTVDAVYTWSVRWLDAQRAQPVKGLKGKALIAAAQAHLARMIGLEDRVTKLVDNGGAPTADREAARYYRLEAELWVERKGKR